jgi:hypothetical protein
MACAEAAMNTSAPPKAVVRIIFFMMVSLFCFSFSEAFSAVLR